jgi:hypothetical protein
MQNGGSFTGPSCEENEVDCWQEMMQQHVQDYMRNVDALPHHYQMHFMHAVEILGYKHPASEVRHFWHCLYLRLVNDFHLHPETEAELDDRLGMVTGVWTSDQDGMPKPRQPAPEAAQPAKSAPDWRREIWNSAVEAAALVVQPIPNIDEERTCAEVARVIRTLKQPAQPAGTEAQVQDVMQRVKSTCHAWFEWCENGSSKGDGIVFDREYAAIESAIRRLVGGK